MSVPWNRAVSLDAREFQACWGALGLDETPLLLELRPPGTTYPERGRVYAATVTGLRERGLWDGRSPVEPLAGMLRLLADSDYQLDIRLTGGSAGPLLGLGAVTGARGVVVLAGRDPLRVLALDGSRVAAALIGLAGGMTPGTGRPVNIPAPVLDRACAAARDGNLWTLSDQLIAQGVSRLDAASLARMCQGIRETGQLGAMAWPDGRARRGPWVVGFHRTDSGHFMQLRRPAAGHPGEQTVTMCPTDAHRLLRRWRELVEQFPFAA